MSYQGLNIILIKNKTMNKFHSNFKLNNIDMHNQINISFLKMRLN